MILRSRRGSSSSIPSATALFIGSFLRDKLDGLKWRNEHGAEKAIREALAPFREEMRESHLQLLRSQPASKEAILTYEVSSLKSRLNELEKKVANLPGPPEAS